MSLVDETAGPERVCAVCDAPLRGRRRDAETCSPACRRERSRLRKLRSGCPDGPYVSEADYLRRARRPAYARVGRHPPTYNSWRAMISRCYNPRSAWYANYGGRGIAVCDRWRQSFDAFLADMGERPDGRTLDRIDSDGNYERGNCRWATPLEQTHNRRWS